MVVIDWIGEILEVERWKDKENFHQAQRVFTL